MKIKNPDKDVKHWETRREKSWEQFHFKQPFGKGLNRLKKDVLEKTDFDPAVLWQWGTMQALAVIEILKAIERAFGREGQQVVRESLFRVGYDIGRQITSGTSIPTEMSDAEWISFYATIVNRIVYASMESPEIIDDNKVVFHIDWCPHQDHYSAFDCRVQRYFVQGMIEAAGDFAREQGRVFTWDVAFKTTIPSGGNTCFFEIFRGDPDASRAWAEYTRILEEKALLKARQVSKNNQDT
ncbi:MAG TPA: hypothetical protein VMU10_06690 [Desulfomonilia bacterium]|nr:hypothetical protein [Desulfomonilia bacterium]